MENKVVESETMSADWRSCDLTRSPVAMAQRPDNLPWMADKYCREPQTKANVKYMAV